jgi:hypothetical protein
MDATVSQVVAANLRRARETKGWSQEQAAAECAPYLGEEWSRALWSQAERSVDGKRIRTFSIDEVVAFSKAFGIELIWWLLPEPDRVPDQVGQLAADEYLDLVWLTRPYDPEDPVWRSLTLLGERFGRVLREEIRKVALPVGLAELAHQGIDLVDLHRTLADASAAINRVMIKALVAAVDDAMAGKSEDEPEQWTDQLAQAVGQPLTEVERHQAEAAERQAALEVAARLEEDKDATREG